MTKLSFLSLLLLVLFSTQIAYANKSTEVLARKAVSDNITESSPAIEELRSLGPAGLQVLMAQHADDINARIATPSAVSDEQWQRVATALDTVAQQKNSYVAGLYWHGSRRCKESFCRKRQANSLVTFVRQADRRV
jgi:hypothetical protein